jgi:hypothetical protein
MVSGQQGMTYLEKCKELGLKTLEERRNGLDMGLAHKFIIEDTGTEPFQRTTTQQRSRTRQAAGEYGLSVQYPRTDPRKHSLTIRTEEPWNRLPEDMKNSASNELVGSRLKKYQA